MTAALSPEVKGHLERMDEMVDDFWSPQATLGGGECKSCLLGLASRAVKGVDYRPAYSDYRAGDEDDDGNLVEGDPEINAVVDFMAEHIKAEYEEDMPYTKVYRHNDSWLRSFPAVHNFLQGLLSGS